MIREGAGGRERAREGEKERAFQRRSEGQSAIPVVVFTLAVIIKSLTRHMNKERDHFGTELLAVVSDRAYLGHECPFV